MPTTVNKVPSNIAEAKIKELSPDAEIVYLQNTPKDLVRHLSIEKVQLPEFKKYLESQMGSAETITAAQLDKLIGASLSSKIGKIREDDNPKKFKNK